MEERLVKYLSSSGYVSRREAEDYIKRGLVKVNGNVVFDYGYIVKIDDDVLLDGASIKPQENKVYYMMYKPVGYITLSKDNKGKTIYDLLDIDERIYPVGKFDYGVSGMLLLTNDSEFKRSIENPVIYIENEYHIKVEGLLRKEESSKIQKGIEVGGIKYPPLKIMNVKYNDEKTTTFLDIVLKDNNNKEIKKIFSSLGHNVKSIKRTRIGNLRLDIKEGKYRSLTPHEVKILKLIALGKIKHDKYYS